MLEIKLTSEKQRKLLDRKEVEFEAVYDSSTPKIEDVKKEISKISKAQESLIIIKRVKQLYGESRAKISAYIYNSENSLKSIEPKIKKKEAKAPKQQPAQQAK